jgi:hypothetical protein
MPFDFKLVKKPRIFSFRALPLLRNESIAHEASKTDKFRFLPADRVESHSTAAFRGTTDRVRQLRHPREMYKFHYSLLVGLCASLLSVCSSNAACTVDQRVTLAHAGYTSAEIDRLCSENSPAQQPIPEQNTTQAPLLQNIAPVPFSQNAPARLCVTNFGSCGLMVWAPVGIGCTCVLPNGVFYGISR